MPERRIVKIERVSDNPVLLCVRPGRRSGRFIWFRAADAVPPFDGKAAMFEIERRKGGGWRVLGPA